MAGNGFTASLDELKEAGTVDLPLAAAQLEEAQKLLDRAAQQFSESLQWDNSFNVLVPVLSGDPDEVLAAAIQVAANNAKGIGLSAEALRVIEGRYRKLDGID